jgi:two-component system chemotaxis sensor kinase CheA
MEYDEYSFDVLNEDGTTITDKENSFLQNKKVLIVDDDFRNVYALTIALEKVEMEIIAAENGYEGIEMLQKNPDIDIILMDIMMPEMDGFEAIKRIREMSDYQALPIIALTAKAMKKSREECLEAGANDYISKPINIDQLFSLMNVWLYQKRG